MEIDNTCSYAELNYQLEPGYVDNLLICLIINNGNRTEWSPVQSVIIQVIKTKSDKRKGRL